MNDRSELEFYFDAILQPLIEIFEGNAAISCDEHGDFFIDLGWDVVRGDGRLINMAEEMLQQFFQELPPMLESWLWWQTTSGRVEAKYNRAALEQTPPDYSALMEDLSEMRTELYDELKQRLLKRAEQAYVDYEDQKYSEDGDE